MSEPVKILTRADVAPLARDRTTWGPLAEAIEQSMLDVDESEPLADVSFSGVTTTSGMLQAYVTSLVPGCASLRIFPGPDSSSTTAVGMLFDVTGALRTIVALDDLNALRTAIPVAVGVKYLAPPDAGVLGVLGSGQQARRQAEAIVRQLPGISQLRVWSPTPANRLRFAEDVGASLDIEAIAFDDADTAVDGSDVVAFAGSPPRPGTSAFDPARLKPGALCTDISFAIPHQLLIEGRLVVPTRTRGIPVAVGFPGGWGPPFEVGVDPLAALDPMPLTAVIRNDAAPRAAATDHVVFELAGTYLWDPAFLRWLDAWARATGRGTELSLA